jgi:hypothetical protein
VSHGSVEVSRLLRLNLEPLIPIAASLDLRGSPICFHTAEDRYKTLQIIQ